MSQAGQASSGGGGGSGIQTIDGDVGYVTGSTVSIVAIPSGQSSFSFYGNDSTQLVLDVVDNDANIIIGTYSSSLTGESNVAVGLGAFENAVDAGFNTCLGNGAGLHLTSGAFNFLGASNAAASLETGSHNVVIGFDTGTAYTTSESYNILIGSGVTGTVAESNTLRIGDPDHISTAYVAGIVGNTVSNADFVTIDTSTGQLGVASSAGAIITIDGDAGSVTGSTVTFTAIDTAGSSVKFSGSGTTMSFDVSDSDNNTLVGLNAGNSSISGSFSTGLGVNSLHSLSSGHACTAVGYFSLDLNSTGHDNTAIGNQSQDQTTTQNFGTSVGSLSLLNPAGDGNSAFGYQSLTHGCGAQNIALGFQSGQNYSNANAESNNIVIGNVGTSMDANTIRIGTQGSSTGEQDTCYIAGIVGNTVSSPNFVTIDTSTGQLGTTSSAAGSLTLIATMTASNSASIDFTSGITSTYNNYLLLFEQVQPVIGGGQLNMELSTDGGSTYIGPLNYASGVNTMSFNTGIITNTNWANSFFLSDAQSTGNQDLCGQALISNLTSGTGFVVVNGTSQVNTGTVYGQSFSVGSCNTTNITVNAIRITNAAGNISTGVFSLYGYSQ